MLQPAHRDVLMDIDPSHLAHSEAIDPYGAACSRQHTAGFWQAIHSLHISVVDVAAS